MRDPQPRPRPLAKGAVVRRLCTCALFLAAIDQVVPLVLRTAEARRYDASRQRRFERSDRFMLGPLTSYLREHPKGMAPRVVFFGNSIVWGYGVDDAEAIPAVYQDHVPGVHVVNMSGNGQRNGTMLLLAKALVDSLDGFYLFHLDEGDEADPLLPQLIPISPPEAERFGLTLPLASLRWASSLMSGWRLARYATRLQAAWFGTSTRQYLYLQVRRRLAPQAGHAALDTQLPEDDDSHHPPAKPSGTHETSEPLLWDYGALLAAHKRRGMVVELDGLGGPVMSEDARRRFNAAFQPYASAVVLDVPSAWRLPDQRHLTPEGCRRIAEQLIERSAPMLKELRR